MPDALFQETPVDPASFVCPCSRWHVAQQDRSRAWQRRPPQRQPPARCLPAAVLESRARPARRPGCRRNRRIAPGFHHRYSSWSSRCFSPSGDIGSLAVYGTVNDLAMGGAVPLYLSAGFIIEEGFPMDMLRRIAASMAEAAPPRARRDQLLATPRVVERGKGDGVFINTTGIGIVPDGVRLSASQARPGDVVILSPASIGLITARPSWRAGKAWSLISTIRERLRAAAPHWSRICLPCRRTFAVCATLRAAASRAPSNEIAEQIPA